MFKKTVYSQIPDGSLQCIELLFMSGLCWLLADRNLTTYRVKKVFSPRGPRAALSKSQGGIWRNGIQSDKQSTDGSATSSEGLFCWLAGCLSVCLAVCLSG